MCRCDQEGPRPDDTAVVQQVEAEMQIADLRAAMQAQVTPGASPETQLVQAMHAGVGMALGALDRAAMDRDPGEAPDTRTLAERGRDAVTFQRALATAARRVSPSATEAYLDALAFAAGVLMHQRFTGEPRAETAHQQYIDLLYAMQAKKGRCCWPHERELLRQASDAIWLATHDDTLPHEAAWTAKTAAA